MSTKSSMNYGVIGLMSGTSLDGLDIAYCQFEYHSGKWNYKIIEADTLTYSEEWLGRLRNARDIKESDLQQLNIDYGVFLGESVKKFVNQNNLTNVDYVSSHGHTVHHRPEEGVTVQIGEGAEISRIINIPVVYDFRIQDVNLGGQGAPLVPIGDQLLFGKYDSCLNLGGFANISFTIKEDRKAFDICPVNIVLNHISEKLGLPYDDEGGIARVGAMNIHLLQKLNALDYYQMDIPKSLGIEWVQKSISPLLKDIADNASILQTFVQHIVVQLKEVVNHYDIKNILITGGGAFNAYLIEEMREQINAEVIIPDDLTVNFKEALIFAFLGVLKIRDEVNVLKSVTGAINDHSSGRVSYP